MAAFQVFLGGGNWVTGGHHRGRTLECFQNAPQTLQQMSNRSQASVLQEIHGCLRIDCLAPAGSPAMTLAAASLLTALAAWVSAAPTEFPAPEARQGVAVDAEAIYVVSNRAIGKYDKRTGKRIDQWIGAEDGPIQHLNSGVVIDGQLYCAHSNYPDQPMTSSIEIWDANSLEHVGSHSFGIYQGSATWVDFHEGHWWVVFANYATKGGSPGKGPEWTQLVQFDRQWCRRAAWVLPAALVREFSPYSNSGGSWGPDGYLYLTGHDGPTVFRVALPTEGSALVLKDRIAVPVEGQGIAWDRSEESPRLFGIRKSSRTVVATEPLQ